jgi:hypothetical protein
VITTVKANGNGNGNGNGNVSANDTVATVSAPTVALGSVSCVDPVNSMAWVKLNAGGFGTYPTAQLVQFFASGWYRKPDNPFDPLAGVVQVVYRATQQAYPEYSVPVTVSDS